MRTRSLVVAAAFLSASVAIRATTLTYTESSTATGSLGGVAFTNALVTMTATGNSASVQQSGDVFFIFLPTELTIAGLGSTMFTDTIEFVSNEGVEDAGVGDSSNDLAVLFTSNAVFAGYNLESAIGPITGAPVFNAGASFNTSAGTFIINTTGNSTFQATAAAATTPEPSTIALLGTGLLGCAGMLRRRFV